MRFESFIICVLSFETIYLPKLYEISKNKLYEVGTYLAANLLMFFLLNGAYNRLSLLYITIFVKIIPTIFLNILGFFVHHDTDFTFTKGVGMFLVIAGLFMLEL